MSTFTVTSAAGLTTALQSAQGGDTILLAPGTYTGLNFNNLNFASTVTIRSADPSLQAVMTNFSVQNSGNLLFQNLQLNANQGDGYWAFLVDGSHDVGFDHVNVYGSMDHNPQNDQEGIAFYNSSNVRITNSEFQELRRGITVSGSTNVLVSDNNLHDLQTTGMIFAALTGAKITNNYITDMYVNWAAGDHPDGIQFMTSGTSTPSTNITISGNILERGAGDRFQGIFLTEEAGGLAYQNLTISNNFLLGTGYNGIAVLYGAKNVSITGNELYSLDADTNKTWILVDTADGVSVTNNRSFLISTVNATNVTNTANAIIAPTSDVGVNELNAWLAKYPNMSWVLGGTTPTTPTTPTPPTPPTPPAPTTTVPPPPSGLTLDGSTDTGLKGDGWTKTQVVRIDGVAEAGASVKLYESGVVVATGAADSSGSFSVQTSQSLGNGAHSITAVAQNAGGVISAASGALHVVVDTIGSITDVSSIAVTKSGKSASNVVLGGSATDDSGSVVTVDVYRDGSLVKTVAAASGVWSFGEVVANGAHTYTMQGTDVAGNLTAAAHSVVIGGGNGETISGTAGADIILGGAGYDTLTGGGGNDVFAFGAGDAAVATTTRNGKLVSVEKITDFSAGDHLDLTDLGHLTFGAQTTAVMAYQVNWYTSGGNTFVVADVNGDGKGDFMVELLGLHTLTAADFLLS